jgi:two-component system nitrogen regulation response regulator NtrX
MADKILIVDDADGVRESLGDILEDEGYRVARAQSAAAAREVLERESCELVLLDLVLPDADGLELLEELQQERANLPVIVISGHGNVDSAVRATRLGAYDFLEKPLALERVVLTVNNALERARMTRRLEQLSLELGRAEELIGSGPAMRRLKSDLQRAAASDSRILIVGENGTGKELVARQAHLLSRRARSPFVEVNCAAIPEELIESELFGHVRGAFTGASSDRAGRFEQADGGTLFLDEVADMSLKTQAKVLRALQEQRFERVGGSSPIQVDVRVIAATNKDLEAEIRDHRFRDDLYFRLAVIPLSIPPLRERSEDVPELVEHFLARYAAEIGKPPKRVDPLAMEHLMEYGWPGNVRELKNFSERMMIMVPGGEITQRDLPPQMRSESTDQIRLLLAEDFESLRQARAAFEKRFIERQLRRCGGNVSQAARALAVERSSLHRKIKAFGITVRRGV